MSPKRPVTVAESSDGPYAQLVTIGRHIMRADEGEAAGGSDFGPSPYEYVMAGLGACTAMTLRMYAARHSWPLEKASVMVRHKKVATADGKTLVDRFERVIHLQGDLTDQQRAHLIDVADQCPVSRTLQSSSLIASSLAEAPSSADMGQSQEAEG
jgi:putative redox protein